MERGIQQGNTHVKGLKGYLAVWYKDTRMGVRHSNIAGRENSAVQYSRGDGCIQKCSIGEGGVFSSALLSHRGLNLA